MKYFILLTLSIFFLISSCQKNTFGVTETDFIQDSAYLTNSDGLLYVEFLTGATSYYGCVISTGETNNPTDTLGHITPTGSITLPIQENTYWMVSVYMYPYIKYKYDLKIQWTPFD